VRCGIRNGGSGFSPISRLRARRTAVRRIAIIFAFAVLFAAPVAAQETLTVFAAASMKNALDDANAAFTKATNIKVAASYAASSALAKQLENGAPADVFVSADVKWMDYAAEKKLIKADSRVNLLGNALVLIAGKESKLDNVQIGQGFDIAKLAGDGRIAVADTKAVPAGLYAKAALEKLGAWKAAEPKLAQAENVRATLAFVARGETPIGIVYATDAKVEPNVKTIGVFPENSHPPVTYPVAATVNAKPGTAKYLHFLRTGAAKAIFEKYGFSYLIEPVS
jgi:molybdate transport system substrate-binding protein